jgi:HSP20 family protein
MADTNISAREQNRSGTREHAGDTAMSRAGQNERGAGLQRRDASRQQMSPFEMLRRMSLEMDRTFDRMLEGFGLASLGQTGLSHRSSGSAYNWMPRIDAFEKDHQIVLRAELPGVKKEDLEVNITEQAVEIQGERRDEQQDRREGYFHSERSYGRFYRAIPLPEGAMADKAEATFKDGVLEIRVPAPPEEARRGRKVEIK